jgi:L-ascorbate metabolism protein UlaG (beta-lactamase superfamily)
MMERIVKVELDREKLKTIDAIYISHSHTDHFDPYTLMEIYSHIQPLLLLPFTLTYLIPLIHEYLGDISIEILYP